jgi:septal ring factor EnvC (AmiA/AmiB activator)
MSDKLLEEILNFVLNNMGNKEMMHLNHYIESRAIFWSRIKELEEKLAIFWSRIKELEEKLAISSQIMDAMTKTSQNNYKLTQQVKDIEQQLSQSNKERAELEQKLAIAVEALEMISLDNIYVGENGWRDEYILGYNQAREALNKINQK